jgi:hypothetical protein
MVRQYPINIIKDRLRFSNLEVFFLDRYTPSMNVAFNDLGILFVVPHEFSPKLPERDRATGWIELEPREFSQINLLAV